MLRLLQRLVASERCMRVLGALSPALRLWHPDVRRDPYPTYRRLRERGRARCLDVARVCAEVGHGRATDRRPARASA